MILATGVDLVELARVRALLARTGRRFVDRICTPVEAAYCLARPDPVPALAARFAAKEAVMKCLGTGWTEGVAFAQIEVARDDHGAVAVRLRARAAAVARERGIARLHLSMSHTEAHAVAMVIAEG